MRNAQRIVAGMALITATIARGETLTLDIKPPAPPGKARYMGAGAGSITTPEGAQSPNFGAVGYDNLSLLKNGKPWLPVMGEFHFSRYPANEWREELLKMKAGGISIVATYIFWNHHEEVKGEFDWTGQRSLRDFVKACAEVELPVIVRMGPWCHGEVRNGGMPDWADAMARKRTEDEAFLAAVKPLYGHIAEQIKGQLWKEGGPVLGVQVDNEYGGAPAYLLALKNMAREVGIDVPIYTRTGWPAPRAPYPYGELMPLFGGYAEGFWDRALTPMPGEYWKAFTFSTERIDTAIASEVFGEQNTGDARAETLSYPYLTCELGGGMMSSYHRRIKINPMDVLAIPLAKVGSGSNLPGYYMYHGGTNPPGKTTTSMQETQSRGMWNDMPYRTYDFQAPLGEYGQAREHYHLLRRFHLFLEEFGPALSRMTPTFPAIQNAQTNTRDLRFAVRSDGRGGFLFVNNYQRGIEMPAKEATAFQFKMPGGESVRIPAEGTFTVPANACFVLPFNVDVGGLRLKYATAQPVCSVEEGRIRWHFFASIPGVPAEFQIDSSESPRPLRIEKTEAGGAGLPLEFVGSDGKSHIVALLDEKLANMLYKVNFDGQPRAVFTEAGLTADANRLRLTAGNDGAFTVTAVPPVRTAVVGRPGALLPLAALVERLQEAGPVRTIRMGSQRVAEHPVDEDFAGAQPAVFRIKLPADIGRLEANTRVLLRLRYRGDVARVYAGERLITDNYYNGDAMEVGLWRVPEVMRGGELVVKILPLQKGAPIYLAKWPAMDGKEAVAALDQVELIPQTTVTLEAR